MTSTRSKVVKSSADSDIKDVDINNTELLNRLQATILDSEKRMSLILNERIDKLESRVDNVREEMLRDIEMVSKTTQSKISKISNDDIDRRNTMNQLENQINKLNQERINSNIIVSGITKLDNENLNEIIANLFNFIEYFTDLNKLTVFRLSKSSKILVKLESGQAKKLLLQLKRKKDVTSSDINIAGTPSKIYINEQITNKTGELYKQARELRVLGMKYVWTSDGIIMGKQNESSKAIQIQSTEDITQLSNKLKQKQNMTTK